jgi:hypothetical protein
MMESNLFLSDGTPICPDFTAAAVISEPDRLHRLRIGIGILGSTIESDTEAAVFLHPISIERRTRCF